MKTFKTLLAATFALLFLTPSYGQLKVIADGKVGIGTSTPERQLEIVGAGVMASNNATYPGNKQSNFLMRHYSDNAIHFAYFNAQTSTSNNQVLFGGGAGSQYAATIVGFLTASNTTTTNGTERMRINSTGQIRMNTAGNAGAITHELNLITGDAVKPGGGSWAAPSDARIKNNVRPFTDGLKQVLDINPVFFRYKEGTGYTSNEDYVGVIAQEMQKVAPYTVKEVEVVQDPEETRLDLPSDLLTYNGTAVTYMLVNAIKEQQAMIDEKNKQIDELTTRLDRIEAMLAANGGTVAPNSNTTNVTLEGSSSALLKQNAPNPFSENTSIEYTLPRGFNSATINITNAQGALMRKVTLPQTEGAGTLNIKAKELAPGEYVYTLVIDGKVIDTKKMVLID